MSSLEPEILKFYTSYSYKKNTYFAIFAFSCKSLLYKSATLSYQHQWLSLQLKVLQPDIHNQLTTLLTTMHAPLQFT